MSWAEIQRAALLSFLLKRAVLDEGDLPLPWYSLCDNFMIDSDIMVPLKRSPKYYKARVFLRPTGSRSGHSSQQSLLSASQKPTIDATYCRFG